VWLSVMPTLWVLLNHAYWLFPDLWGANFAPLLVTSYRLLAYISYNLDQLSGHTPATDTYIRGLFRQYHFIFYIPYLFSVIVLYRDWQRQMDERVHRARNWSHVLFFAARMLFWTYFIEFMLHFMYFEAILRTPDTLRRIPENQLVAIGGAIGRGASQNLKSMYPWRAGQFFHMKYVVIFGIPSLFAKVDRMQPPEGPMCVSRVALYSKVWRSFDRGLYVWFKTYIFVPICQPTFSVPRRLFGLTAAYAFVLLWHGVQHHNIVWVVLNVLELLMEQVGDNIETN
jgi:hypothetical protein